MTRDAALADRSAELAKAQSYIIELCDALGVEKPRQGALAAGQRCGAAV